ncbi:conserved domain protein [Parasutterella excrementihominis YIT 11859]|uniref:Conserved domain protein n=1 Tax=Parasutterella excrementihominis YIT 11859 TaxID=762966 RepID=F3QL32_9BURK|nr:conserved domain protein [Parasutterella excrementihominis YIT 11859]
MLESFLLLLLKRVLNFDRAVNSLRLLQKSYNRTCLDQSRNPMSTIAPLG